MLDKTLLRAEIDATLKLTASADAFVMEARAHGLLFLVDVRPGQAMGDVARVFAAIDARFEMAPLFPSPPFDPPAPGAAPTWRDCAFVARLRGVAFGDISINPWDIAHAARLDGGFEDVRPDILIPAEVPPQSADTKDHTPGWERKVMCIEDAWKAFDRENRQPGKDIFIGHPDSGWYPHRCWDKGGLDLARAHNFLEDQPAGNARDRLDGPQPGHGCATASVMVAPIGYPVEGIAPFAKVLPIRCLKTVAQPTEYWMTRALRYATEKKCQIISNSWGGVWGLEQGIHRAISDAVEANIIVIAAAGQYIPFRLTAEPANYAHVIGVAGLEQDGKTYKPWEQSSRGPWRSITISAPACQVNRAFADPNNNNRYELTEGTSYATAFTAGIAALWLSFHFPNGYSGTRKAQYRFKDHVQRTAETPSGFDDWFFGLIRADRLMNTAVPSDEAVEGEEKRDYCVFGRIAAMLNARNTDQIERLLAAALDETDRGALKGWAGEIVSILHANPDLRVEIASRLATSPLSAQALGGLLAPAASNALRARL